MVMEVRRVINLPRARVGEGVIESEGYKEAYWMLGYSESSLGWWFLGCIQ